MSVPAHVEPIVVATEVAQRTSPPSSSSQAKRDPRLDRLVGRVAIRCVQHLATLDRTLFELGRQVARLIRHHDRATGLSALARRIRDDHGRHITPQHLGQSLKIFESYTRNEVEKRFSTLSDTHLLTAAQAYPSSDDRAGRNEVLDHARRDVWSVSELKEEIKQRKQAGVDTHDEPEDEPGEESEEPRGYVHGVGLELLRDLADRSVALLWLRSAAVVAPGVGIATRVLQDSGLLAVECPSIARFPEIHDAVGRAARLQILDVIVVVDSSIDRREQHDLPIADRYRLVVLVGCRLAKRSPTSEPVVDNPMGAGLAREIVLNLVPEGGCVVDVGQGSIETARWATSHEREYLAVEPIPEAHKCGAVQLRAHADLPSGVSAGATGSTNMTGCCPVVRPDARPDVKIDDVGRDGLSCYQRTRSAAVITRVTSMQRPSGGVTCAARIGRRI